MEQDRKELARTFYKSANLLKDRGDWQAALADYDRAIDAHPDYAHALCNRGVVLAALGRTDQALQSYDRALALDDKDAIAHFNRGVLLQQLRAWERALASYDKAITQDAGFFHSHFNRANVLKELARWDAAIESYGRAIALSPGRAEPWFNLGVIQQQQGKTEAALESYDRALAINPDLIQARFNRANVLKDLKRYQAAVQSYDLVIAARADHAEAWSNRGTALQELGEWEAALGSYDQAIAIRADYPEAWSNRGMVLHELRRLQEALASYGRALELRPGFADAQYGKSISLLLQGDYAAGWPLYEWRWPHAARLHGGAPRVFQTPLWLGREDLKGKRILIYWEQGLGDTLQYCRYIPLLAQKGAEVIFEVQAPLMSLLRSLPGVGRLIAAGSALPKFDYHCPLLSLPLAFGTTLQSVPASVPYLRAEPERAAHWRERLGERRAARIGFVCSGAAIYANDTNRSIALADWISRIPRDRQYVCLQKEYRDADRATLAENSWIADFAAEQRDFSDAAALVESMDLVISVDTSMTHLAGALARPTWLLLSFNSDARWMMDRDDSPWYPTLRIYRQKKPRDWVAVLERVAADLRAR
jgi:tetratricopeptide (TPR) repeat protein